MFGTRALRARCRKIRVSEGVEDVLEGGDGVVVVVGLRATLSGASGEVFKDEGVAHFSSRDLLCSETRKMIMWKNIFVWELIRMYCNRCLFVKN